MPHVLMYTKTYCSYCKRARKLLERKGIDFTEVAVDHDRDSERLMVERSRRHSVPQIFIDDRHIGGYTDLAALDASGELDTLLGR
jgi:glutaredoxin 3